MGSAVPCSEARLRPSERVSKDGTQGLREAGQRSAMCPAAIAVRAEQRPRRVLLTGALLSGLAEGTKVCPACVPSGSAPDLRARFGDWIGKILEHLVSGSVQYSR